MKHHASPEFWKHYRNLPSAIRILADKNFALLKQDPQHPSLHFKRIGRLYSVRIGISHRAVGAASADSVVWFWIGSHANHDKLLK